MKSIDKRTTEVLKELNIPMGNLGFSYLRSAIVLVASDENMLVGFTRPNGLYCQVAEEHHTTSSRTERAIRHSIEIAYRSEDKTALHKFVGSSDSKAANRNFIAAIAYEVKSEVEE